VHDYLVHHWNRGIVLWRYFTAMQVTRHLATVGYWQFESARHPTNRGYGMSIGTQIFFTGLLLFVYGLGYAWLSVREPAHEIDKWLAGSGFVLVIVGKVMGFFGALMWIWQ